MPLGYNTGVDYSLTITRSDTGAAVSLGGNKTKFEFEEKDTLIENDTTDDEGRVTHKRIPSGISGSIETERATSDCEDLMAFLDANYYTQGPDVYFTIVWTAFNADKLSTQTRTFTRVVLHGYKSGQWMRKDIVKPSVQFAATEML
jgi:hypothetical protein